ncbi:hypothetical protein GGQ68_002611 [Sagittula marina]|uniref:Uncharacterized protein n=1 Tax=Sagittula marina TaxID=943940 RepID=A0A7W6DP04_9RHOB|nr:hypothetical protein [Sagittula marina]MBB3986272.1 hypothetical protein [Sagittula marina]
MNRNLTFFIGHMAGVSVAYIATIAFFVFGWVSIWSFVTAAALGLIAAWPLGKLISRRIKKDDPTWSARHDAPIPSNTTQS